MDIYHDLRFPPAPEFRPYTFANMIATIDGKILSGERDESVHDLGSSVDKLMMKRIEASADAILLGAATLRATPKTWNPRTERRLVVTGSGNVPRDHAFLSQGKGSIVAPRSAPISGPDVLQIGSESVNFQELVNHLRKEGVERLLVMGGSDINAQLFRLGLIDEIFLTVAPKLKLGEDVPTIAGGIPFDRQELPRWTLIEHHAVESELFLRYRIVR